MRAPLPIQKKKKNNFPVKKTLIVLGVLVGISILIAIVVFLVFTLGVNREASITNSQILSGATVDMKEKEMINFEIGEDEHTLTIDSIDSNSVDIIIQSRTIRETLTLNEVKKIDFENDGVYDLSVELRSISGDELEIFLKKINEDVEEDCTPNWDCEEWGSCIENNKTRTCEDSNNCRVDIEKPVEVQECEDVAESDILDCGTSHPDDAPEIVEDLGGGGTLTYKNYEKDDALVCFGNNLLGECNKSKVELIDEYGKSSTIETIEIDNGECTVKFSIGEVSNLDTENKEFENTYMECPIPMSEISERGCFLGLCKEEGLPGQTTFGILVSMIFDSQINPETKCTGTRFANECRIPSDCKDYTENTAGFCNNALACEYHPFEGECRETPDCPSACENCVNETFRQCNLIFVESTPGNYIGKSSCVSCFNHEDCNNGFVCNREQKCVEGTGCTDDTDCETNEYCGLFSKTCTEKSILGEECDHTGDSCIDSMCLEDICVEENFYDQFVSCTMGSNECTQVCTNCEDGIYSCPFIGGAGGPKCVECAFDSDCNDGYECSLYQCIPETA